MAKSQHQKNFETACVAINQLWDSITMADVTGLRAAFEKSGCGEKIRIDKTRTDLGGFSLYGLDQRFDNNIYYNRLRFDDTGFAFVRRTHEIIHALQAQSSVALHANPGNKNADIILCPRDYLLIRELAEEDARAKETLVKYAAAQANPHLTTAFNSTGLSIKDFETALSIHKNMSMTLAVTAISALNTGCAEDGYEQKTLRDYYADMAFFDYYQNIARRQNEADEHPVQFVRLGDEDIYDLGTAFGPCTFGSPDIYPAFQELLSPSAELLTEIAGLSEALDITDDRALPTLSEALTGRGQTPQSALTLWRANSALPPALN